MTGWIDVGPRSQLREGGMMEAEAGAAALLLYDLGGVVFATAATCPHHAAWLSQGQITGTAIDCPRHMGQFDIATGAKLRGPDCPNLRTYPTRVAAAGRIEVWVA
jgi:nitrite reductase/ring-hydroxylating ferredoxin subunit